VKLSELKVGECGKIKYFDLDDKLVKRLKELGFIEDEIVEVLYISTFGDPIIYRIMGSDISLNKYESDRIIVEKYKKIDEKIEKDDKILEDINNKINENNKSNDISIDEIKVKFIDKIFCCKNCDKCYKKSCSVKNEDSPTVTIKILLVGNPNCGKTTLFNLLTSGNEQTGNYSGVTVDEKKGYCYIDNYTFEIYDLPGTYSVEGFTSDEKITANFLKKNNYDVVINVINSTVLKRSLYLTEKIKEIVEQKGKKMICALNFYDKFIKEGYSINLSKFEENFNIITVPIISEVGFGVNNLMKKVISLFKKD
jgi:ferrous iron transport protein B